MATDRQTPSAIELDIAAAERRSLARERETHPVVIKLFKADHRDVERSAIAGMRRRAILNPGTIGNKIFRYSDRESSENVLLVVRLSILRPTSSYIVVTTVQFLLTTPFARYLVRAPTFPSRHPPSTSTYEYVMHHITLLVK